MHFISYERPFRLPPDAPRLHFHPVGDQRLRAVQYPDYTLPLSVKMAEVSRDHRLDVLHVHYAVPHATAAILARSMLPPELQPRVVTTLHGTDTTLLGHDPGYGAGHPARADLFRRGHGRVEAPRATRPSACFDFDGRSTSFTISSTPRRRADRARRCATSSALGERGGRRSTRSNLRPVKRIDLLLETAARVRPREAFKLVILAGEAFAPFAERRPPARPRATG